MDLEQKMTNDPPSSFSVTQMNQTAHQEAVEIELDYESGNVGLQVLFLTTDGILQGSVSISDYYPFKMWSN